MFLINFESFTVLLPHCSYKVVLIKKITVLEFFAGKHRPRPTRLTPFIILVKTVRILKSLQYR